MTAPLVLVTGASSGIGRATALLLDSCGYRVLAGVRRADDADALRRQASSTLRPVQLDVTSAADVAEMLAHVGRIAGPAGLAAVINNAGFNYNAPFEYTDEASARAVMETNVFGVARVTQALLPALRSHARHSRTSAKIVIVGSIGSVVGVPWESWYHVSKFAVLGLAESLRHEVHAEGVRVSAVLPGGVRTAFLPKSAGLMDEALASLPPEAPASYRRGLHQLRARVATAGRFGTDPERVAARIASILARRNPAMRYYVGLDAQLLRAVTRLMPGWMSERVLRAAFAG
jgi:NAD(P)-dependent dehydrogenase (short-subunit alcohol dehydrogenase family)